MESGESNNKEMLSEHVEKIFRSYSNAGLHICDIATGGGKSYTIGKLTCEYYPSIFDRIIILCVQNKLVDGMNREIDRFISSDDSLIKSSDKLVIENNAEVVAKAVKNHSFDELLGQMNYYIGEQKRQNQNVTQLQYCCNRLRKTYEGLCVILKSAEDSKNNEFLQNQLTEGETSLRYCVKDFFETYKKYIEVNKKGKKISVNDITKVFPALVDVYPQVEFRCKKVLIMTIHKAMYGIDPILSDKILITDFADKKKTLILFDESDQAAVAMRSVIIDQSMESAAGRKRFDKGYKGYLHYKDLIDFSENLSDEYYGTLLEDNLNTAKKHIQKNWNKIFKNTKHYKSIFLNNIEDIEEYRRGVFFSGPILKLNISQKDDKKHSFICYKEGAKHLNLVHSENEESLSKEFKIVVPMDRFLSMAMENTTTIKVNLRNVVVKALENSKEEFEKEVKAVSNNSSDKKQFLGYPTLDREIHTLLSRFENPSEIQFEQQLKEFITNRKNLIYKLEGETLKLPDYTVYSQGVQFYQEEIDEKDNQHRVRLSCREISTTPEKILVELLNNNDTSVVLCSATASSASVASNFDIKYLKQRLGNKISNLSSSDRDTFDELVEKTYPKDHKVEVVSLKKYEFPKYDASRYVLPDKYMQMFSKEAQEEGKAEEWFRMTVRDLVKDNKNAPEEVRFQLSRLLQFIEAYHWFWTHDDIHSMLYFQNRSGDKDKVQVNILSSLIDGSYKDYSDFENKHIRISKDMEEVENSILKELSEDKDAKIMLISAYGSFKAGANIQYEIPEGLECITGDIWEEEEQKQKKDWDAVYLQTPTNYLMVKEDGNELGYEKSLYNAMLTLMMLLERGCLSPADVSIWMCKALSNNFYFGEKGNPGITKDKAAWAQTTIEQAVGRLCRTKCKPYTTYILYDESMTPYFEKSNLEKSLTKEFRTLANYILSHPIESQVADPSEIIRCNDANGAQSQLDRLRRIALRYTPKPVEYEENEEDDDDNDNIPHIVKIHQIMNQSYKHTIISKPVIGSLDDLTEEDKMLTFISKCYGNWERDESRTYNFSYEGKKICPCENKKVYSMSPSVVRLDVLMKNDVIKRYFEKKGYATEWAREGLILHPQILATDYAGEIGEEAFKALILHYTDCQEDDFVHLENKDYELADFVIKNTDGTYKIAFDVKNMRPDTKHEDGVGDLPTTEKRKRKRERLGCELITVNMLEIEEESIDAIREINGMITSEGNVISSAIERIKSLING